MSPTEHEAREYLRWVLGDDWEEALILADAIAGPNTADIGIDDACDRAVMLVHERRPDIAWDDERDELVREAWWALWVDNDPTALG